MVARRKPSDAAPLFPDLPQPDPVSAAMREDLKKLQEAGKIGLAQYGNAWESFGLRIGPHRHSVLVNQGLACVVSRSFRHPRLTITAAGLRAIGRVA